MSTTITVPNIDVELTLDQVVAVVTSLNKPERAIIARAIADIELDRELASLIDALYSEPEVTGISDEDIFAEIESVRQACRQA